MRSYQPQSPRGGPPNQVICRRSTHGYPAAQNLPSRVTNETGPPFPSIFSDVGCLVCPASSNMSIAAANPACQSGACSTCRATSLLNQQSIPNEWVALNTSLEHRASRACLLPACLGIEIALRTGPRWIEQRLALSYMASDIVLLARSREAGDQSKGPREGAYLYHHTFAPTQIYVKPKFPRSSSSTVRYGLYAQWSPTWGRECVCFVLDQKPPRIRSPSQLAQSFRKGRLRLRDGMVREGASESTTSRYLFSVFVGSSALAA